MLNLLAEGAKIFKNVPPNYSRVSDAALSSPEANPGYCALRIDDVRHTFILLPTSSHGQHKEPESHNPQQRFLTPTVSKEGNALFIARGSSGIVGFISDKQVLKDPQHPQLRQQRHEDS
jgi:hypothetical protein